MAQDWTEIAFGPYLPLEELGAGGTGVIVLCRHRDSGEIVAVKTPKSAGRSHSDQLQREIGILRRLRSRNIAGVVRIVDSGTREGVPWYAMDHIQGTPLRDLVDELWALRRRPGDLDDEVRTETVDLGSVAGSVAQVSGGAAVELRPSSAPPGAAPVLPRVLAIVRKLLIILENLHNEGVVHGDLTPGNVLLRSGDDPVLIDFGIALVPFEGDLLRESSVSAGLPHGTPGYIAPEVITGEAADARSDLYALGCVLYELVTGRRPFLASSAEDLFRQHLRAPVTPPRCFAPDLPPELDELIVRLLHKDPKERPARARDVARALGGAADGDRAAVVETTLFRSRLIGRQAALSRLEQRLAELERGRGGLVVLSGPSGVGKTRLLKELGTIALRRGSAVIACTASGTAHGATDEFTLQDAGLSLFRPVIARALQRLAAGAREAEPDMTSALAVLRPYARDLFAGTQIPDQGGAPDRGQVLHALGKVVEGLAGANGLVLVLDDLQWADEFSLSFLSERARELAERAVLFVVTQRSEEPREELAALARQAALRVDLGLLALDETRQLTKELLGASELPEGLAELLQAKSEGNPLFVAEYVRALLSRGVLHQDAGGRWVFPTEFELKADAVEVPRSLEALLVLRTENLSEAAQETFRFAAVIGREFDVERLASDRDPFARAEALEELVARQILECTAPGRYRFAHDKLREVGERQLPEALRASLHRRAAERLEELSRVEGRDLSDRIGYHWARAGEPERALGYLERAAETARATFTLGRARDLYGLALAQCELLPRTQEIAARLNEALAEVLVAQARHREARQRLESVLAALPGEPSLARVRLHRKLAASYWTQHEYASASQALDAAERELERLGDANDPESNRELIQVRLGRFEQLYFSQKTGPAVEQLLGELAPLIDTHGTTLQKNAYYLASASNLLMSRRYAFQAEAVALADKALQGARELSPERLAFTRFMCGFTRVMGDKEHCAQALPFLEAAAQEAEAAGDATLLSRAQAFRAKALRKLGEPELTAAAAEIALGAAEAAKLPPYIALAKACAGWAAWHLGQTERARRLLNEARNVWRGHPHPFPLHWLANFPLLALAHADDDLEQAKTLIASLLDRGQQALPADLEAALEHAARECEQGDARQASAALLSCIRLGQVAGFV